MIAAARWLGLPAGAMLVLCACSTDPSPEMAGAEELSGRLTGTVTYRERIRLRPDAVVSVRLEDISLADAPSKRLAEQTIEVAGRSVPIPYELVYDAASIDSRMSYAVRAEIRDGAGKLLWTSDTVHPALTRGAPEDGIDITVVTANR